MKHLISKNKFNPLWDRHVLNIPYNHCSVLSAYCWFHGSSFKGFSIVFPIFWLAKVESNVVILDIFSPHICSSVTETIQVTSCATSFGAKKCSENQVRSCWDNSWSVKPKLIIFKSLRLFPIAGFYVAAFQTRFFAPKKITSTIVLKSSKYSFCRNFFFNKIP